MMLILITLMFLFMNDVAPQPPDLFSWMKYRSGVAGSGSVDPCGVKVIMNVFKNKRTVFQFD